MALSFTSFSANDPSNNKEGVSKSTIMNDRLKPKRWAHIGCEGVGYGREMVTGRGILRQALGAEQANAVVPLNFPLVFHPLFFNCESMFFFFFFGGGGGG